MDESGRLTSRPKPSPPPLGGDGAGTDEAIMTLQGKTDMNPPFTVHLTRTDYSAIRTALLLYLWKVQDRIKGDRQIRGMPAP